MATDQVLLNLLHISDLHFGDMPQLTAELPRLIKCPLFDGQLGHHYRACSALHDFYKRLWDSDPRCQVIVTGDITASGAETQFDWAHVYLGAPTGTPNFGLGLGLPNWPDISISGNHDQWPGTNGIFGRPTAGLKKYFKQQFPIVAPLLGIGRGLALRFLFIDTDADVWPFGTDRLFARGDFVSQLIALGKKIPQSAPDEIRILVMHHSLMPESPDPAVTTPQRRMAITSGTRKVLDNFLVDYGIKIVLSGHLHVPRLTRYRASNGIEATTVLEARCGTTTQRDEFPYELVEQIPADRRLPPNTLIVHTVLERSSSVVWRSEIFWRNRTGRFVNTSGYNTLSLPTNLTAEIQLLPSKEPAS